MPLYVAMTPAQWPGVKGQTMGQPVSDESKLVGRGSWQPFGLALRLAVFLFFWNQVYCHALLKDTKYYKAL